jgi:aminodeoxyfutalosine synthase
VEHIERLIREAGREPIERDTLYRRVERQDGQWKTGEQIVTAG